MRLALCLTALLGLFSAFAARLEVEAERIEFRPVTLPDGSRANLIVITGSPARITVDEDLVEAEQVEYDRENNLLRIVGFGRYVAEDVSTSGEDFVVDLNDERFRAREVLIVTEGIDITGFEALRFPGQIDVISGRFSPCARCPQETEDYSFRAERLTLYPGDRLLAFNVTVFVRDAPLMQLPFLILPLAPPERTPRLSIAQGTATARAEIELDWPYVSGPNAHGFISLRYFADVVPGGRNIFTEALLGGDVVRSYLGGGISHRYFLDDAVGALEFHYRPAFYVHARDEFERDQFSYRWHHETPDELMTPRLSLLIERDDARRQRLSEYGVSFEQPLGSLNTRFFMQGYIDHDPTDVVTLPSYAGPRTPERTYGQLTFSFAETVSIGPFRFADFLLDIGAFQDASNRANRSALARGPRLSEGRLLERHALGLVPLSPWEGFTFEGATTFQGQYYTTGERLVIWNSRLSLQQSFGTLGNLNVTFGRNTTEGETPFSFDAVTPVGRTDLSAVLSLRPLPWFSIDLRHTYVFLDTRRREAVGPGPLDTTITLFGDLPWISLSLRNSYDFLEGDPGELSADLTLTVEPLRLTVNHVQDLQPGERLPGVFEDITNTRATLDLNVRPYVQFEARGGYNYVPTPTQAFWEPLTLAVTAGTLDQTDLIPGLRVSHSRNLNTGAAVDLGLELAASYGAIEFNLRQEFDFDPGQLRSSRYLLSWRGVVGLEAAGFALLPPQLFGIEPNPVRIENWIIELRDLAGFFETEAWRLRYATTRDFTLIAGEPHVTMRNSRLEAFANLPEGYIEPLRFSLDFAATLLLADDALDLTYLQSAGLRLNVEAFESFAVQGTLTYRGFYDGTELTQSLLELSELAFTVRLTDELYLSTIFNDIWDFSPDPDHTPFNFQPLLYVVWDRCCWALYGSWDTATGRLSLAVGMPGAGEGFVQEIETGIQLPGRGRP